MKTTTSNTKYTSAPELARLNKVATKTIYRWAESGVQIKGARQIIPIVKEAMTRYIFIRDEKYFK